jgi:hypothetical protein
MKRILTTLFLVFAFYVPAWGQTLTIDSVSSTTMCAGDPLSVTFTATGTWGHKNAFTLQLSNDSGNFDNGFLYIGSLIDSLSGTFTINTTIWARSSTHYRIRVLAASLDTEIISADNGSDIAIGTKPPVIFFALLPAGATGTPTEYEIQWQGDFNDPRLQANVSWDFGSGANPPSVETNEIVNPDGPVTQDVTYSTPGDKTVTLTVRAPGGCSSTVTQEIHIYDCSDPVIPNDAIVINSDTTKAEGKKTYWVNPGYTFYGAEDDTIFAEAGSTISGNGVYQCVLYMMSGSVLDSRNGSSNSVIFGDGASIIQESNDFTLNCPNLTFDYTTAPPNSIMHINENESVSASGPPAEIEVSPNPTNGIVTLDHAPAFASITAVNVLGERVAQMKASGNGSGTFDLSSAPAGTYYVRIASGASVVTKTVVKQ